MSAFCEGFFAVPILLTPFSPSPPALAAPRCWFFGRAADGRNALQT